jgi:hypothetical protein
MFTVAAVLPFLPLIEDAMIRQLGDDDFAKREAATRFLGSILRRSGETRNYRLFLKLQESQNNTDAEICMRSKLLCQRNKKHILDKKYPYFCVMLKPRVTEAAWIMCRLEKKETKITDDSVTTQTKKIMEKTARSYGVRGRRETYCLSGMYAKNLQPNQCRTPWFVFRRDQITDAQAFKLMSHKDTLWVKPLAEGEEIRKCIDK